MIFLFTGEEELAAAAAAREAAVAAGLLDPSHLGMINLQPVRTDTLSLSDWD